MRFWGYLRRKRPLSYDIVRWRCDLMQQIHGLWHTRMNFLRTALEFSQKNQLQKHITSDNEVRINGEAVQMDKLAVRGGIFGSEGKNAGLVFGFRNSDTHATGIATGHENSWPFPAFFQADITKITGQEK